MRVLLKIIWWGFLLINVVVVVIGWGGVNGDAKEWEKFFEWIPFGLYPYLINPWVRWISLALLALILAGFFIWLNDLLEKTKIQKASTIDEKENDQVDFTYWDNRDEFLIIEAACLWVEQEPPLDNSFSSRKAKDMHEKLHNAVKKGKLSAVEEETLEDGLSARKVMRSSLLIYAESIGERPKFLFPEDREEAHQEKEMITQLGAFNLVIEQDNLKRQINELEKMNPQTPSEIESKNKQLAELREKLDIVNSKLDSV